MAQAKEEKMVKVEALKPLNRPKQKPVKKGQVIELPETAVKKLEAGDNPAVKRVGVE